MTKKTQVVSTSRQVIENKLLAALEEGNHVALICSEDDLTLLILSLTDLALSNPAIDFAKKASRFAADIRTLRDRAFR